MNFKLYRTRYAIPVCLSLLCIACGGTPPREDVRAMESAPASNYFIGTQPVYVHLVRENSGSWVFTTVTDSDASIDTGFLVRLNDLTPAFDIRVADCVPQVYPDTHRCSPLHPFRDKDTGMIDKIINSGIAVGTAGKVTDISQTYETTFDEAAFNRAVDEALLNTGLDGNRRRLITLVDTYDAELHEARTNLSELTQQVSETRSSVDRVELDIQPSIDGLTEYYQGDIDFAQLVDLDLADGTELPAVALEEHTILPCDARHCTARAEGALATLQQDIEAHKARLSAAMQPGARAYNVRCEDGVIGSYLLTVTCPAQVVVAGDEPAVLPISVTLLSRDFDRLYPAFDLVDDHLQISIDDQSVTFSNATDEYITLTAQTVYYNSKVHTTSLAIDIPPGISVTRSIDEFVSQPIDIESSYRQMTPDKAAGASFRFGFAARYRIASQPEEQTLHDQHTFNVGCAIDNQLQPGSCRTGSAAKNAVARDRTVPR